MGLKKISRNVQYGGKITDYWLKYKIFASQQRKFVTIASAVWNMKILLKQHGLRRKRCHWRKLVMVERWKSKHPFGIKLEKFVALADHIIEEVINRKELLFVTDLNRFYGDLVSDLVDDKSDVRYNARNWKEK